jgi:hypothetical protein
MDTQKGGAGPLFGLVLAVLVAPGVVAGCATESAQAPSWTSHPNVAQPAGPAAPGDAASKAWATRPAYVRQNARTEEAYAYAMASPQTLRWMPCYCGCGAMGHGSNLDCFFKPTRDGLVPSFEEHASYCDICVETALLAKQMSGDGASLRTIRDAIDARFGGGAPGTPTELPPV